jgi:hypothetical protein
MDLLGQPFIFPTVAGRRVLLLGLGGGCDIISAYALSRLLPPGAGAALYANTKNTADRRLQPVTAHIYRVPAEAPAQPLRGRTHGTTRIDESVPRGDEGCPLIFMLAGAAAEERLVEEIHSLHCDLLFGVDTGGDSLSADAACAGSGRDRRMLRVLRRTGLPLYHVVVAPGSDGERTGDDLRAAMRAQVGRGCYRGCFSLEPVLDVMRELSAPLSPQRTPRIILSAAAGELKGDGDLVTVPRGRKPVVPRAWLLRGFVFVEEGL